MLCAAQGCDRSSPGGAVATTQEGGSLAAPEPTGAPSSEQPKLLLTTADPADERPAALGPSSDAGNPAAVSATTDRTNAARVAAPSSTTAPSSTAAPRRRVVVAAIGDSLTDYRSNGGKFLRFLEKKCPESRFDNFGKGADMVNQMRRRFASQILPKGKQHYTHVIVYGGVNDLYSDLTAGRKNERIQLDLTQMYDWSQELGAEVVAINVSPWGGFRKYFNPRRGKNTLLLNAWIAAQRGSSVQHVVDSHSLLRCGDDHRLCPDYAKPFKDGLHFGPAGHEVLGEALFQQVFKDCR